MFYWLKLPVRMILIGTPTAGRGHADLKIWQGMFVNMIPLRNHADATLGFKEFLSQVKQTVWTSLPINLINMRN
ncbi:hypothetical protein CS542_07190 [Pedobacter sp. IW39]|nr:hypothetical protein CS542_07190 [Pedobacter sp. IW39]